MELEQVKDLRLAVLIDAENVPHGAVREIFEEIAKYGVPTFKRIYADWTGVRISGWKNVLLEHAITPIQQYSYTIGKNSTDSALIIDAMDILYSGKVDGFCIVSSDSDFTRLATRLKEAGMKVIGIGEKKTPRPLITACDKFIYIEILKREGKHKREKDKKGEPAGTAGKKEKETPEQLNGERDELIRQITDSIEAIADENGWAFLGELGNYLLKKNPDFDPRNYGYEKLLPLIKSLNTFEIDARETTKRNLKLIYVRVKH